jgi:heterodisulfide reductase subunit B
LEITYKKGFAQEVYEASGENVNLCFQCKQCTAGCPVVDHFDLAPHRLMRAIQLGQREKVLNSKTVWLCAACEACSTRCPQGLSTPHIADALRITAAREGIKPAVPSIPIFYQAALRGIKMFGRMYEAGLMGELYTRLALAGEVDYGEFVSSDIPLALKMVRAGKLSPLPPLSRSASHKSARHAAKASEGEGDASQPQETTTVGYYPGCSLHGTAVEFDLSTRAVAEKIGLDLVEPDGWVCCGTTPAHSTDHVLSTVLPMKSLKCVEQSGQSYVTVPCPSCYIRMRTAMRDVATQPELKDQVEAEIKYTPSPDLQVEHLLTTIQDKVGVERVAAPVTRPLKGLKVVCYYGCVVTRPPELTGATEYEYPMGMDHLMEALGAEVLDWSYKTECCGNSLMFTQLPVTFDMNRKILDNAKAVGAEAIVVACPLCQANLDMRQKQMEAKYDREYNLPVLYFTQLMGLAYGLEPSAVGLEKVVVDPKPLLESKGILPARQNEAHQNATQTA